MLKKNKISRFLSLILIVAMVLAQVSAKEVKADVDGQDIFVITSFEDQDEWTLEKTTFAEGTSISDMKFPEKWKVTGYFQSDETKTLQEIELDSVVWKGILKSSEDEEKIVVYSEEAPVGEYSFKLVIPENMILEDGVNVPSQKILVGKADEVIPEEPKKEEPAEPIPEEPKEEKPTEPIPEEPKKEEPTEPIPEEPKKEEPAEPIPEEPMKEESAEPIPEEPKKEEPTEPIPEEPKQEVPTEPQKKVVWTISARFEEITRDEPRIIAGRPYRISYDVTGEGVDPKNLPVAEFKVIEGLDVIQADAAGRVTTLKAGSFKVQVSCKDIPENVECNPLILEGVVEALSSDAAIHWFKIGEWEGKITEDSKGSLIEVQVPYGTDVTKLIPEFEIGEFATVDRENGTVQDFTNPVIYTVTAEDGIHVNTYTVKVTVVCEHQWESATCTKPETCKICHTTRGEALGHKWKDATCTEPKTCTVCKVTEGEALGHKWKDATCTEPETCTVCKVTRGTPLGHNWGDWKVIKQPTVKEGGVEERTCARCQEKEKRDIPRLNIIGKAENNYITGIKEKGVYGVKEILTIAAHGDGMGNDKPIANDVRYLPTGWKVTSFTTWNAAPYQVSFSVKAEGNYQLQVHFQKQIFDGEKWVNQKETDVKAVNFSISANKVVPVKTGDENPIGILVVLILLSFAGLMVGAGFRIHRRNR